jgi:hypothetical protein
LTPQKDGAGKETDGIPTYKREVCHETISLALAHAGYEGHKRRIGAKVHVAVDTVGHRSAAVVTPACEKERAQVTGKAVALAYVEPGLHGNGASGGSG